MTPWQAYQNDLATQDFSHDPAQEKVVGMLQNLYDELLQAQSLRQRRPSWLERFRNKLPETVCGLYLWGGVGRGKTYLMDLFYHCLPIDAKRRVHFHRFMQSIHRELKAHRNERDPLNIVAAKMSSQTTVLCFDEFFVADIGDAMILSNLLRALFRRGVTLVTTSNSHPDTLYQGGLQRDRFLPAIELLKEYTQVFNLDGAVDYRLRYLDKAEIFHWPLDETAETTLQDCFNHVAPESGERDQALEILGREIFAKQCTEDVAWFDFNELCRGPRSHADYIELARQYHTVLISNIPIFTRSLNDEARRFVELVDEFYDRKVNLIVSAEGPPEQLYQGSRLSEAFQRTASRLLEMQSHDYLGQAHRP